VGADGIYLQARLEDAKQCILVIIGATPEGKKELLGFTDGTRESAQDWREMRLDLQNRGLIIAPELAVADGALGFWKALGELWPTIRERRCRVHKTAHVLDKPPKSQQPKAKRSPQEIWMAETRPAAKAAFDAFIAAYELKYDRPPRARRRIAKPCSPSTIPPPSTGNTRAPRTRSRAPSPPGGTARSARRGACRIRRPSPGCSSRSRPPGKAGAGSMATTSRPSSFAQAHSPKLIQGVRFTDGIVVAKSAPSKSQTAAA
jgi:putative transposase